MTVKENEPWPDVSAERLPQGSAEASRYSIRPMDNQSKLMEINENQCKLIKINENQ